MSFIMFKSFIETSDVLQNSFWRNEFYKFNITQWFPYGHINNNPSWTYNLRRPFSVVKKSPFHLRSSSSVAVSSTRMKISYFTWWTSLQQFCRANYNKKPFLPSPLQSNPNLLASIVVPESLCLPRWSREAQKSDWARNNEESERTQNGRNKDLRSSERKSKTQRTFPF